MKFTPHVIQLSQLRTPKYGKGRPYTVDFGIAKPLHLQLLSYLTNSARILSWPLITGRVASTRSKAFKSLAWGLISIYILVILSFMPSGKIIYADPIVPIAPPQPLALLTMPAVAPVASLQTIISPLADDLPNLYAYGNCTAYVASKLPVPDNWGNANEWAVSAAAQGYTVSDTPKVGAIAQTGGDSSLGHVAIVSSINDDGSFTVSEMNYYGLGVIDERITSTAEFQSFIYI